MTDRIVKTIKAKKTSILIIILVLLCGFLGALGQLTLKFGTSKITDLASAFNWQIILGLAIYIIATAIFLTALRHGDLTIIFPSVATSYVWASIFSVWYLGEVMTVNKWMGNFLIMAGVFFIGYSERAMNESKNKRKIENERRKLR